MPSITLKSEKLTAAVGDNSAEGAHRSGYNGVWSLTHKECSRNLFVPTYAGLNLEHIFDGDHDEPQSVFFEPRTAPMKLRRISHRSAELVQEPLPTSKVPSQSRFTLVGEDALDMEFIFRPTQHTFPRGYIGVFWASYINAPEDKSMYYVGGPEGQREWQQLCTPRHNDVSTVRSAEDRLDLTFREGHREALYRSMSPLRFTLPFFYGHFENMTWLVMLKSDQRIRLTHSPSGGGKDLERMTTCPAWDFQLIVFPFEVLREYRLHVRTLYRPRMTRTQVQSEAMRFLSTSHG